MDTISKNLEREVKKGKIDEAEKGNTFARLQPVVEMSAISVADFAIEAVPEKIEIKRAVLTEADKILREGVVIASNTSSIAMTALAALTKRPERFVGMHFMNPVPVDATRRSHPCAADRRRRVQSHDGAGEEARQNSRCRQRCAGLRFESRAHAAHQRSRILRDGRRRHTRIRRRRHEARHESSDGPLELADFIGLDVCVDILNVLLEGLGDPKYRACPLLKKYVAAGWLGRKSAAAFTATSS